MNVQGFKELKQVLSNVPQREFNISNWKYCACGHATHDQWFQRQGFTSCHNFYEAAAFFGVSYTEAKALFSGHQHSRRQAIIDSLLAKANQASHKARRVATALVGALF